MKYFKINVCADDFDKPVMRNIFFYFLWICMMFSCNTNNANNAIAENAFDAGREFIDAGLKGDFEKAAVYMKDDTANKQMLLQQQKDYDNFDAVAREEYRQASIIINQDSIVNDTVHIISYANSYDKKSKMLKVIFTNKTWLVDLK